MRMLFIILCWPIAAVAQLPGRQDDSLRKISDTLHFPNPFSFNISANTRLSTAELTKRCYDWMASVKDSLKGIVIVKDPVHKKMMATNVPATADVTFTILVAITGTRYVCSLQDYIYHTINGKRLPVDKAATIKDYQETAKIEKVIIMRNYHLVFDSLNKYLKH
jgi:hypothetical protein